MLFHVNQLQELNVTVEQPSSVEPNEMKSPEESLINTTTEVTEAAKPEVTTSVSSASPTNDEKVSPNH